jgi:hypothetical protein
MEQERLTGSSSLSNMTRNGEDPDIGAVTH